MVDAHLGRPEIMGIHHPITHRLEAHNCWLVCSTLQFGWSKLTNTKADIVKDYIAWAVGRGYGVIDVNIPKHITAQDVWIALLPDFLTNSFRVSGNTKTKTTTVPMQPRSWRHICGTTILSTFVWLIVDRGSVVADRGRPNDATHIFFLGVGDAFYGVANLLINRGSCSQIHRVKPRSNTPALADLSKQIASTNASIASFRLSPITLSAPWHRPRKSGCRDGTRR